MKEYTKLCPKCGVIQTYNHRTGFWYAKKHNTHCRSCVLKGVKRNTPWMFDRQVSEETRDNLSKSFTNERKCKLRVEKCTRLQRLGVTGREDAGAPEYFESLNASILTDYFLKDIGYYVDGYDIVNNTIYEYDTPYHKRLCRQKKDLVRQNNIIEYFKRIDNPLNSFIRTNSETKQQTDVLKR